MTKALSVDQVSVVLSAHVHNPSIINPDFLKSSRIVPTDWTVTETITTPGFSQTDFENGIGLTVDEARCVIRETIVGDFRKSYRAHAVARAYIRTLPHVPYSAVGLNWLVRLPRRNSKAWLLTRFLRPGSWLKADPAISGATIRFEIEYRGSTCFLVVAAAGPRGSGDEDKIVVDANFHYEGPFAQPEDIDEIISGSEACQSFLGIAIKKLLSGKLA